MIGSLFMLALTSLVGVSLAMPLSSPQVDNSLPWVPSNYFVSDNAGISCSFQQFYGDANVVVNGYSFDSQDSDVYVVYGIGETSITELYTTGNPVSYTEICNDFANYYGGFVVYFGGSDDYLTFTPYWKSYVLSSGYNYSFWGFLQESSLNSISSIYAVSGSKRISLYADDEFSFDSQSQFFSHNFIPEFYGGEFSFEVHFASPLTWTSCQLIFACGHRTSNDNVGWENGYNVGFNDGQQQGYNNGYRVGNDAGYVSGHYDGYIQGYQEGLNTASGANFNNLFFAIADTPVVMLRSLFSFDLFGMNVFVIIMSLLTAMIVLYVIKKVWK